MGLGKGFSAECCLKKELYSIIGGLPLISQVTRKANLLTGRRLETRSEINGEERITGGEVWHSKGDKMIQLIPHAKLQNAMSNHKKLMTNIQNQYQIAKPMSNHK